MTENPKSKLKEDWEEFKKDFTPNNIKLYISSGILPGLFLYGYTFWIKLIDPLLKANSEPKTPEQAVLTLCVLAGLIAPLWLLFPLSQLGYEIGKFLKLFKDNRARRVWWDDITYFVRDMPDEEREKIKQILAPYKSKLDLRKERKANESWLRRNFT